MLLTVTSLRLWVVYKRAAMMRTMITNQRLGQISRRAMCITQV
jgi:hypothetical protein